jgi:hypothetical protein
VQHIKWEYDVKAGAYKEMGCCRAQIFAQSFPHAGQVAVRILSCLYVSTELQLGNRFTGLPEIRSSDPRYLPVAASSSLKRVGFGPMATGLSLTYNLGRIVMPSRENSFRFRDTSCTRRP